MSHSVHRPRNVDWKRAAAILYGDWGTSKAYVIGLAFVAARFASFPIISAVCLLTGLVGYNYLIICKHYPDGGGVYSAARAQSRLLAVIGALLLVADMTVTASLSGYTALSYFGVDSSWIVLATIASIVIVGFLNFYGPRHSGSIAVTLAIPAIGAVLLIIFLSLKHLKTAHFEPSQHGLSGNWVTFVSVILALSGVEAIANLTGVMKLDPGATMEKPRVQRTARIAIILIALEVVIGTALCGWAMLSLPKDLTPQLLDRKEDMLRFLGEYYGQLSVSGLFGKYFGMFIGVVMGLLLISAVNTAIVAMIGLLYMMARDGEMPKSFLRLNTHGVPWIPLGLATALPIGVLLITSDFEGLASLYAIGVVGAIAMNLGSCTFNKDLHMTWYERGIMGITFLILIAIEITIAKTKPDALFFAVCVLGGGLALRAWAMKRSPNPTPSSSSLPAPTLLSQSGKLEPNVAEGQRVMVAVRGLTPTLRFAIEEASLRKGPLYVLFVKELAVTMPGTLTQSEKPRWQDDVQAHKIISTATELATPLGVSIIPLYVISESPAFTIVDLAATLGVDFLLLGVSHRRFMAQLMKGNVAEEVMELLPENIQLVVHG